MGRHRSLRRERAENIAMRRQRAQRREGSSWGFSRGGVVKRTSFAGWVERGCRRGRNSNYDRGGRNLERRKLKWFFIWPWVPGGVKSVKFCILLLWCSILYI